MHSAVCDVAIVGAGMAGASAACTLTQHGHRVTVFDKSRGPGGRMSTRQRQGWQADHGAQYFTVKDPIFAQMVAQWQQWSWVAPWSGRVAKRAAATPHAIARSDSISRWVSVPTMPRLAQQLLTHAVFQGGCTVVGIDRTATGRWQLHSAEQGAHTQTFDAVLLALPLPQLAPFAGHVPPPWIEQWQRIQFEPCWAGMLRFDQSVPLAFDGLFANHPVLQWVARTLSKPSRQGAETWTLHATPAFSRRHLESSADEIAAQLCQAWTELGGPTPNECVVHRWRYALAVTSEPTWPTALSFWDRTQQLGVCGDWLAGGRVEGAWRSGHDAAMQLTPRDGVG